MNKKKSILLLREVLYTKSGQIKFSKRFFIKKVNKFFRSI